jgi:hypothetical protein
MDEHFDFDRFHSIACPPNFSAFLRRRKRQKAAGHGIVLINDASI